MTLALHYFVVGQFVMINNKVLFSQLNSMEESNIVRDALLKYSMMTWLLLSSALSSALGLGQIEHQSWLGEPLKANVEIIDSANKYRREDYRLRQVYPEEARALGVDVVSSSYILRTEAINNKGTVQVLITTDKPVFEPFLNFMLVLEWPDGKTYREYSLLLDPKTVDIRPAVSSAKRPQAVTKSPSAIAKPGQAGANTVGKAASSSPFSGDYWTVRPAQTISQIAQRVRQDPQIQLQAVTNFLYQQNPQAFAGGLHQLLVGQQLRLPSDQDYASMARKTQPRVQPVNARPSNSKVVQQAQPSQAPPNQAPGRNEARVEYQVQAGDTLSQVAQKMRQNPNRKLQDVIDQLYRDNPDAFSGGKHGLKVGAKLQLAGSAAQSNAGLGINQSSQTAELQAPAADQLTQANNNASLASGQGQVRLNSSQLTEEDILAGKLPAGSVLPISQQIQMVAELTDKLNLENSELRQRINQIESSENIALLQQLVVLQAKQIDHFRAQLEQTLNLIKRQDGAISDKGLAVLGQSQVPSVADGVSAIAAAKAKLKTKAAAVTGESAAQDAAKLDAAKQNLAAQPGPRTVAGPGEETNPIKRDAAAVQAAHDAGSRAISQASADANNLILWMLLAAIAILCLAAMLIDLRKEESWLRAKFFRRAEATPELEPRPQSQPGPPEAKPEVSEPEVRVRVREREKAAEPTLTQENILARPRPGNADKPFPGVARWSHRDIPQLDVEETAHESDEPATEDEPPVDKPATEVNFDDFGLISLDDLDIDLEDGLDNAFDLDIDQIETQDSEEKKA